MFIYVLVLVCIHICMLIYVCTHTHTENVILLNKHLEATTRGKKKKFFIIPKISSCGNCREHYVVIKFPVKHHIRGAFIFSGFISL